MSSKDKVWFNWHCPHCQHRNRVTFAFQFEIPQFYTAEWDCEHCGEKSKLELDLKVYGWYKKEKKFRLKRKRKSVKKKTEATKKDRGYVNHKI
jgi:hypothetical protein